MATKKTGKGEVVKPKKAQVVTITADQFIGAVQRFGTVCDYVETQMRKGQVDERALALVREDFGKAAVGQAIHAPKPTPSVEQMACEMRSVAEDVAKQAQAIRERLTLAGLVPDGPAGTASTASQGPLKDYVDATMHSLYSIRRDLDSINQYAIG